MNLRAYLDLLNTYLKKEKKGLAFLFFLLLLNVILQLLGPAVLGAFLNEVRGSGPMGRLYAMATLFLFLSLAREGIQVLCALWTQNIGWRTTNQLRRDLLAHTMNLDLAFHKNFSPPVSLWSVWMETFNPFSAFSPPSSPVFYSMPSSP